MLYNSYIVQNKLSYMLFITLLARFNPTFTEITKRGRA